MVKRQLTKEDMRRFNKYMKKSSIIATTEMQIKTTMPYYFPSTRIAKIKRSQSPPNVGENSKQPKLSYMAGRSVKWDQPCRKRLTVS